MRADAASVKYLLTAAAQAIRMREAKLQPIFAYDNIAGASIEEGIDITSFRRHRFNGTLLRAPVANPTASFGRQ